MITKSIRKIITYTVIILGIYLLLRFIPRVPLDDRDIIVITLVLFVAYLLFDNFVLDKFRGMLYSKY